MGRKDDLKNSRALYLSRTSSYAQVDRCVEELLSVLYQRVPRRPGERRAAIQHLKTLVMDLYAVYHIDAKRWLGHSREPTVYRSLAPRYNPLNLSGKRLIRLIDELRARRLIQYRIGFRPQTGLCPGTSIAHAGRGKPNQVA